MFAFLSLFLLGCPFIRRSRDRSAPPVFSEDGFSEHLLRLKGSVSPDLDFEHSDDPRLNSKSDKSGTTQRPPSFAGMFPVDENNPPVSNLTIRSRPGRFRVKL